MCGIVGFIATKRPDFNLPSVIRDMTDSLSHRGPDDSGYTGLSYADTAGRDNIAFGHRRLKIIDLTESGHQPMFNRSKTLCIIYNGEIYNYLELKDELVKKGVTFISTSDTEVVLAAYEAWGTGCFKRFNGMWAMAIFDKARRKVVVSRDRFGKKPLYYYKTPTEFVFASEIKALLKNPVIEKRPNYERVFRYIAYHYRFGDIDESTFFDNIYQVPKSNFLEIDESLKIKATRYWELDPTLSRDGLSDGDAIEKFKEIFFDAVKLRLRSDVPVGCMLSGGMDSTSVTCVANSILKAPIITFSGITGEEKGIYDESEFIEQVIKKTKADSHYIRQEAADIFETVAEMLRYHDEPICTVTWSSLFLIAKKMAKERVPVVLNGHGGDELLAGYWDHYHYNFYDLFENGDIEGLFYEIKKWKENHGRDIGEISRTIRYISSMKKARVLEMSRFPEYSYLLNEDANQKYKRNIELPSLFAGELSRRLDIELMYDGVPTILRPEDRNTMSQSLESRSPFLDYRLVEFCFSLPNRFKIRDGTGKWLLREAMKGILPEPVRVRKDKAGFIAPADRWFRTVNKDQLNALLNSESFKKRDLFDMNAARSLFEEHLSEKKNHQMVLWQIINLELWFRRFFDE